jgi:hypothetical protein
MRGIGSPPNKKKEVNIMEELIINRTFNTREEMEEFEKQLKEEYIVLMIVHTEQVVGEPNTWGIHSIKHFGKR